MGSTALQKDGQTVDEELWRKLLTCIEESIGPAKFSTWFDPLKYLGSHGQCLRVQVPNRFTREWLSEHYLPLMVQTLRQLGGPEATIQFEVGGKEPLGPADEGSVPPAPTAALQVPAPPPVLDDSPFNPRLTFENFVVGPGNQLAHAACLAVAQRPADAYNPLFLYGGVGLGKTHLLHSIGHHVRVTRPNLRVTYISSENFLNDLVNAIQAHDVVEFRNTYRTYDILMIDDIQFIAGKERTQEEFFHTFNDLYNNLRQIILTSDRAPKEMSTLEDRLRSRFEWGMIADLQPPDLETRMAILKKKAAFLDVHLPDEVGYLIATQLRADVRKLEGALNRLVLHSSILGNRTITEEMATLVLRDMLEQGEPVITVERIQEAVCSHFRITLNLLTSNKRNKEVATARQVAMYLARQLTKSSLPDIGRHFGGKDHTTVIHACEKIKRLVESDPQVKAEIDQLVSRLQG
ncbi:MAG: chromosomal replication initiator protein DnaA [Nitrospinae bacterium]|nr:chromosomal replication initiator protein DnaA [Nitrospinota bacterium]